MRQIKPVRKWTRLMALLLALAMLLAGCSSSEDSSRTAGSKPEEDTEEASKDDARGAEADTSEAGSLTGEDEETLSEEDQALLDRSGLSEGEEFDLTDEDVKEIGQAVAGMNAAYVAGPGGADTLVKERDWSVYTSALAMQNLSRREAELVNRMDKMAMKYLSTSALDGVKKTYGSSKVYYATEYVSYSDLGIGDETAKALFNWFRYNYPQYYFLDCSVAVGGGRLCGFLYDFAANGKDRAQITNELFDKLEGWVQTVADTAATTYQKELYANNLICETVTYNYDALEEGHDYEMNVCQSLYSTVMLEDTVCAGYSKAFTAMMSALGVEATAGLKNGCHAWNVVHFDDGNYYCVDVCWNDTDDSARPYRNDYLNVGENDLWKVSSRGECHTYSDDVASWIPAVAEESYVPTDSDTSVTPAKPAAPANVKTVYTGETTATTSWDPVPGATSYGICVYTDATFTEIMEGALYSDPADEGTESGWTGVRAGATYYFGVRAEKTVGDTTVCSDWVNHAYTHTPESTVTLDAPADIAVMRAQANLLMLSWTAVEGETYTCEVFQDPEYTKMAFSEDNFSKGLAAFTNEMIQPGVTFYVRIRAVQGNNVSDWVYYTTTIPGDSANQKPAAPTNIQVTSTGEDSAKVTWDPVDGASGYQVCLYTDSTCSEIAATADCASAATLSQITKTLYVGVRTVMKVNGEDVYSDWVNFSYTHTGNS